jgi:molybdate transport system substrate-binding protein
MVMKFAPAVEIKKRIDGNETFDIAILTTPLMDDLAKSSTIAVQSRFNLVKAGVGVAFKQGAPKPDIATADAFKRAMLAAKSVAYVGTGASASVVRGAFERLGIAEQMKAKTKLLSGMGAADAVAKGEAELGFTQISEILGIPGAELAGPLPPEVQVYTVFAAAGNASAPSPLAALAFLQYLRSAEAVKVFRAKGLEPG